MHFKYRYCQLVITANGWHQVILNEFNYFVGFLTVSVSFYLLNLTSVNS